MTVAAFESIFTGGGYVVTIGLVMFAFTTLLGWSYYGEKCVEYMFGVVLFPFIAFFLLLLLFRELYWNLISYGKFRMFSMD